MKPLLLISAIASAALAQPPVAPTNEPTESTRGDNMANYNILNSFETGYRFASIGGNGDVYRSMVNYTNGIRLLSSSLSISSKDGHGAWFDQFRLNTLGLGNDPYESATLRIEKNRIYRYDMSWRENAYLNPALTISSGEHALNTSHRFQDHDLVLFPDRRFQFFLGYSRVVQDGPALTTVQLFDARGDEYPLFENLHWQTNEYRLGGEARLLGFRLNVLHGWQDFKEDSPVTAGFSAGNNPNDLNTLTSLRRPSPLHGTSPYWRLGLFREGKKYWAMNGRFTYVAGRDAFVQDELAVGTSRFGAPNTQQTIQIGDGRRPAVTGDLTITVFPTERLTVTNQTSVSNLRMIGNSFFELVNNGGGPITALPFSLLGIRSIANQTVADLRLARWIAVHAGYDYDDRRVQSIEGTDPLPGSPTPRILNQQTNILQDGLFGIRLRPLKPLSINLDAEIGRANRPIFPISDGNYHALNGRVSWTARMLRLSAYARSNYNTNSRSFSSFASKSRQYGADASWIAKEWFSIDMSYAKLHLDTLGTLDFFLGTTGEVTPQSYYVSNIHTGNLSAHFTAFKRVDFSLGFSHVQDVGDKSLPLVLVTSVVTPSSFPPVLKQTFPLRFTSPFAKISVRMSQRLRWNFGYQYYGYSEEQPTFSTAVAILNGLLGNGPTLQNFRAQTGYSSLSWSF
jgi:hypothetical protein